jgi:DNA-binding beta-propeller fold protein YncE
MVRPVRRRVLRWTALVVAPLAAAGLSGCSSESVTPANSHVVVYAAIGATTPNPGTTVAAVSSASGALGTPITVGTLPSALALLPGAKDLLVTVRAQDQLVEVDTESGDVTRRVGVGLEPDAVAVTPDGSTALVANFGDDTVTEVHLPELIAGPTIHVGRRPVAIALTPDGHEALVLNYQDGTLTPVTLPSSAVGAPVPVGTGPVAVSVPSASEALVADFQTNSLTPVSLPSLTPQASIPLGADPTGIGIAPGSSVAWVSAGFGLTPVSLVGGLVGRTIALGVPAQCIAVTNYGQAWVCSGNGALVDVDLRSDKVTRTVELDGIPAAVAIADVVGS